MHPFQNLSIRIKVALMGGILVVSFLLLGGTFASSLNSMSRASHLFTKTRAAIEEAGSFLNSSLEMETDLRGYLASGSASYRNAYDSADRDATLHLQQLIGEVGDPQLQHSSELGVKLQITRIRNSLDLWKRDVAAPFWASRPDRSGKQLYQFLNRSEPRMERVRRAVEQFRHAQQDFSDAQWIAASNSAKHALNIAVFGSGLALFLVLLGFSGLAGSIIEPLLHLTDMSQAIAAGDYSRRAPIPGRNELGRLAESFNKMAGNLEAARDEQSAIRIRLEALNQLAAHVARSLYARDRAEAVVMTLMKEFGAEAAQVCLPEARQGWVCIESKGPGPIEYDLFSSLPAAYESVVASRAPEQRLLDDSSGVEWICPLLRADRLSGLLRVRFPMEQWIATEPLLSSINRFCTNAFELARVYELVDGERHRLDAILSSTGEGVLVRDREGKVALANPAALGVLSLEDRSVIGLPLQTVLQDSKYDDLLQFIETGLEEATGPEQSGALAVGDRFITATRAPIQDQGMGAAVVVIRDVTQQVEVDRMKSEFISIVSHELRTPLTSIKGSIGLLLGGAAGALPDRVSQLLQIAQNNSDRLIRLINDILDISKIEAGRVQMATEPVDMAEVIHSAIQGLESMAQATQVRLATEIPADERLIVLGDRDRLLQVVTNLLSNAVKFSPPDSAVLVKARAEGHSVSVDVVDHGPGIPPEHQEQLFQKFYQVDSSSARAKSGTGLGLAISQAIVKEHGGFIGVENNEDGGCRFWFSLPPAVSQPVVEAVDPVRRPRILVCDDDPDIANLIAMLLEQRGYSCERIHSGPALLERLKEEAFDLVTLDLSMPGMDGLEIARRLQEDPRTCNVPVVFVTGREASAEAKELRVAGWVTKPIDEPVFGEAIRRALRLRRDGPEGGEVRTRPLILLVDDDPDVLQVVGAMVESAGMDSSRANGGAEALMKITTEEPDAVVLDIMMPGMDGFAVVNALRQGERTRHIPVLVLTAKDLTEEERDRLHLGETRFLTKSYASQEAILDDLSQLLEEEGGRIPAAGNPETSGDPRPGASDDRTPTPDRR